MFSCQFRSMGRVKWKSISSTSLCVSLWNLMARNICLIQKPTDAIGGKTGCCRSTAFSFCDFWQRMLARISMAFWIPYRNLWQGANDRSRTSCVQRTRPPYPRRTEILGPQFLASSEWKIADLAAVFAVETARGNQHQVRDCFSNWDLLADFEY